ncbi:MAG: glycoside hydrolase family 2 [Acidobacteria bacterium]|nr:glycoside hydrolase family 2 [Acidobacteriota bacterium]
MHRRRFLEFVTQVGASVGVGTSLLDPPAVQALGPAALAEPTQSATSRISPPISLDGEWLLATDPSHAGMQEQWWRAPRKEAKPAQVPWGIQGTYPGYHGVVWYWREVSFPSHPYPGGRYLLKFWDVDYLAEVWVNGISVGRHEGSQAVFVFDVTQAAKPGAGNQICVRVLDPTKEPIEGVVDGEAPHGCWTGSSLRSGGILDSVELLLTPQVRIADIAAFPQAANGQIQLKITVHNAGPKAAPAQLLLTCAPAASGEILAAQTIVRDMPPGETVVEASLQIEQHRRWELHDPFLYRVSAQISSGNQESIDEASTRCGFRDFRFENGYFRLNGRRIFLRCSHSGSDSPVGVRVPENPDLLRRDLVNSKAMGFNMIRFIAGLPRRFQLDLCDELGLMVYEESYASWMMRNSPHMAERFNRSLEAMIRRDRNHPSIVIWGLLNETGNGPIFQHAITTLPRVRALDPSRLVLLGSGRFDCLGNFLNGLQIWKSNLGPEPNITHNPKPYSICYVVLWTTGQVALHPGAHGEYSVVRWKAPADGEYAVNARFEGTAPHTTTDLHVLHNASPLYESFLNLQGCGNEAACSRTVQVRAGDTLDFIVGWGGSMDYDNWMGSRWVDNTALDLTIRAATGKTYDLAADFSLARNPNGVWSYGYLPAGRKPDVSSFTTYAQPNTEDHTCVGGVCNPGSEQWEDVLSDQHYYPKLPHTKLVISRLRSIGGNDHKLFLSEYGVGSAVDLITVTRHFEQIGQTTCENAQSFRKRLDSFMADWDRWKLADTFVSPENYFRQAVSKMAGQRRLGINALRSNPLIVGYNLTGTSDPAGLGEGLTTAFRDFKPGAVDAMYEVFQPLRWCLFVEPVHVYRKTSVRFEAVLTNEDALPPGKYPVRFRIIDPKRRVLFEQTREVTIQSNTEAPFVLPVFSEEIMVDCPAGKCQFTATFLQGGAATGGEVEFYVGDAADLPPLKNEVVVWGKNEVLSRWLHEHAVRVRDFSSAPRIQNQVILVDGFAEDPAAGWPELIRRVESGATAIFLSPDVFRKGDEPLGWLPLSEKGRLSMTSEYTFPWVYPTDEWLKEHPITEGLPAGGLMDYLYWRDMIPDVRYVPQQTPDEAIAGSIRTSLGYESELMLAIYRLGKGRFVLNTLNVTANLGKIPAADRLLCNMLRFAAGPDADKQSA